MKWLFVFAHPDDESVACGGTIKLLTDAGHQIHLISVTAGDAGEIAPHTQAQVDQIGSLAELRRLELENAAKILGIQELDIWDYRDGTITNQTVWGKLTLDIIDTIAQDQPDFIVTFDHTGWYYHLDHVAVSIATCRAAQRTQTDQSQIIYALFHPPTIADKWPYCYPSLPLTHQVEISSVIDHKIKAVNTHQSQDLSTIRDHLQQGLLNVEQYQINTPTDQIPEIFKPIK